MAVTATHSPGGHHPWLAEFEKAPIEAFGDLLSGYAKVFPYDRADAPDAARMLFGPLPADDPLLVALDRAVMSWLEQRRKGSLPRERPKLQRAVREICEAFEIIAPLGLPDAAADLRRRFIVWNEWVARLVLSPARDARAEYWRSLALTQPLVAGDSPGTEPHDLEPLWYRLCREAGGSLPKRYLGIGLLGLRRLPETESGSEVPWLAGLAHWALAEHPSESEFNAEWLALKALYPRSPHRWRELVARLLSTPTFAGMKPPAWWGSDPDFAQLQPETTPTQRTSLRSPLPSEARNLVARFNERFLDIEPRIDALFERHRRFVNQTGDPQYFVRAVHVVGDALLDRGGDDPHARARKAQLLAREGLTWEPRNPFLWSLWRDALAEDGLLDAAELVGWESVHLLPNNVQAYVQLAALLARRPNRRGDAEALFRHGMVRFPRNLHARTQLAELLIAENRIAEAIVIVDNIFIAGLEDAVPYALRARLYYHEGKNELARDTVRRGLELNPANDVLLDLQYALDHGEPLFLKSFALERPLPSESTSDALPSDPVLTVVLRSGSVRRLRFRLEHEIDTAADALAELRRMLGEDPTFAYAELLAVRYGAWESESNALPSFASAFEEALRAEDRAKLEQLAKFQPRLEALILVARAVLGDEDAALEVEAWLRVKPATREAQAVSTLRAGLSPILRVIEGGLSPREALASHREAVMTTLHDANEAGLDEDILLAA
jgi:tetratricopeptide (TPR) repeat protein